MLLFEFGWVANQSEVDFFSLALFWADGFITISIPIQTSTNLSISIENLLTIWLDFRVQYLFNLVLALNSSNFSHLLSELFGHIRLSLFQIAQDQACQDANPGKPWFHLKNKRLYPSLGAFQIFDPWSLRSKYWMSSCERAREPNNLARRFEVDSFEKYTHYYSRICFIYRNYTT